MSTLKSFLRVHIPLVNRFGSTVLQLRSFSSKMKFDKCSTTSGSISADCLAKWNADFQSDKKNILAANSVCQSDVADVLINRNAVVLHTDAGFNTRMSYDEAKVTDQKSTGRCWLFAATNIYRLRFIKKFNLEDNFELSQSYLFFWDKLEKSNYFLENIIQTRNEPLESRIVHHLLSTPINDGGQYDMFVNIIEKYGIVPKSAFPETKHSCNSRRLNDLIIAKLREFAMELRDCSGDVQKLKDAQMTVIYRIMVIFFGVPPSKFTWGFRDKKEKQYFEHTVSPHEFATKFVAFDTGDMISLISDPRNEYYKLYTVEYLGNIVGGNPVRYVNVPIDELSKYAAKTIAGGDPVWFGCDVGKHFSRDLHIMDLEIFDYNLVFGTELAQNREQRLRYGQSLMTHAMVLNAFHGDAEKVTRWRVENSWGDKANKGFATMTHEWFKQYVYQVVVNKSVLPSKITDVLSQTPIAFPAWDPMGSLA
uniref:bleomycin hydrolase n=1 Tax=Spongospora subterranea TaxID=70186 RepID=A0A0H5R7K1_9EUKA|eukprot:CRZ09732.1 hypothetical protein [Spongospora subterranea]